MGNSNLLESWLSVPGFEGFYEVSSFGRVRSLDRLVNTSRGSRLWLGRLLKPNLSGRYLGVALSKDGIHTTRYVHHLVAHVFLGNQPSGMQILHGPNGIRDNSVGNLRYGTAVENEADKFRDGTKARGERHGISKLTEAQAKRIKFGTEPAVKLACELGVSCNAVRAIRRNENWAWL